MHTPCQKVPSQGADSSSVPSTCTFRRREETSDACFFWGLLLCFGSAFCPTVLERKEREVCQDLNKQGVLWTPPLNGLADTGCWGHLPELRRWSHTASPANCSSYPQPCRSHLTVSFSGQNFPQAFQRPPSLWCLPQNDSLKPRAMTLKPGARGSLATSGGWTV